VGLAVWAPQVAQLTRDSKSNTSSNNDSIPNYAKTLFTAGLVV
jgi:hypothetical protein